MFGWLKRWGPAAREAREQQEVEDALARTVAMARAIETRRAAENRANEVAARARDAVWTRSWEAARAAEDARHRHARAVVQEMATQRAGNQSRPPPLSKVAVAPAKPAARSQPASDTPAAPAMGLDDGVPLYWPSSKPAAAAPFSGHGGGFDGGGASGNWSAPDSAPSSSCSSASSSDSGSSGSSDSGGGCGGGSD